MFGFGIYIYYQLYTINNWCSCLNPQVEKNAPNFNLIKSKYYPINKIIFYQMKKKNYVHNIFTTNLK